MIDAPAFKNPAACDGMDPDLWFPEPGDHGRAAKWICNNRCPARDECLTWALTHPEAGVWGGTTTAERKEIRRARNLPEPVAPKLIEHGTRGGAKAHGRRGEKACAACAAAENAARQRRRRRVA